MVRVSVQPVDLEPFRDEEAKQFILSLGQVSGFHYLSDLSKEESIRVGRACDGIPLAIKWIASQCESAPELLSRAEHVERTGKHGEELLEFCFRRVFDSLSVDGKLALQVLALFNRPLQSEAILVSTALPGHKFQDLTDRLLADSLIQRMFDPDLNDYCYGLLPITRSFVYGEVRKDLEFEPKIRRRLTDYYEARDVADPRQRIIIREIRQGRGASEAPLLDLAKAAERQGDLDTADGLYQQAIQRNPSSWRAAREYAEFLRHKRVNIGEALKYYEQAAVNAPRMGPDRALIFREWGMLLRVCGAPDAADLAIEKFEIALEDSPNDPVVRHALAAMLKRKGMFERIIVLLEPLVDHHDSETRSRVRPLLLEAYEMTSKQMRAAELRHKMRVQAP